VNFLAHIYLSGEDPEIKLGNFMADAVKGNQVNQYNQKIQIGIRLHRAIDAYTDAHPTFRQSTRRLHGKQFGHYAGVIVDLFYDHFLAANWQQYHQENFPTFAQRFYALLDDKKSLTPKRTQHLIPYMIEQNWLVKYQTLAGLDQIMRQMNKRTKGRSNMDQAGLELRQHYPEFLKEFQSFFKELITFSREELERLTHNF
jgi:acyl carrier protein phosphodiesterase